MDAAYSGGPVGHASLEGTKFGLYNSNDQLVETIDIHGEYGHCGYGSSAEYPFSKGWYLKELQTAPGFKVNNWYSNQQRIN